MTLSDIHRIADLFAAARSRIPVCPHEWRELQLAKLETMEMSKAAEKIGDGLRDAVAFARIDKLVRRKMREVPFSPEYDKGFVAGLEAARALFGKEVKVVATRIGKATIKDGKVKPVVKQSVSRKIAATNKADRTVKALKANRASSKSKQA